jgi:hypothetical protein
VLIDLLRHGETARQGVLLGRTDCYLNGSPRLGGEIVEIVQP